MKTLLVPYYEHPAEQPGAWDALVAAAPRLHGVVLNPASGPGEAPDAAFAAAALRLREAGVRVLGYADTDYARRPHAEVVRDLLRHRDWYGTDGAFLDQVSADPGALPHYRRLAVAARAAGSASLVLNHGVHPDPGYADLADLLVTFEGPWDSYRALDVPAWTEGHPPDRFCHLVYGAPPGARASAAVHCVVPGTGAHPWGTLPYALEPAR
ncbi:spherulation-specific family 4 protein [Streptomyces sp. AM8-1-1]|uniref:spherulation-specific family 4 protein n=1 Tax=Streptomyces sp. AM8-1-1 TaxID=3075825 RepID=UPI0028C3C5D1|nr:spherulation-specific family 4 protein [Streptomyces sp. AM8-1-1]WNO75019.1 spherulation-specific family 4 protein [Streptomyces sp. AM8-1-1]